MCVPREQYDELLGGKEELPPAVSIIKFANARSEEIAALTEAIEEPQNNHLAFQRMPKHLRRRAMSHNFKRMPKRLQEVHLSQMEKAGLPVKSKRPSRKHRRKPCNLLLDYNRRQRAATWLETHIWHAKRFHMVEKWGYKLPYFPNDKSFRACYRATAEHCLVQDLSYLVCIELQGPELDILQGLGQLTSPQCGLTFAAKATLNGFREGSVIVFKNASYPFHAIGKVTFMWRPETDGTSRTLWMWCHPAFHKEFLQELISVFQFRIEENCEMDVDPHLDDKKINSKLKSDFSKNKNVEKIKCETKNIGKLPKYSNKSVVMYLLKDCLNRFRLTGPLAQVVLTESLKFVNITDFIKNEIKEEIAMEVDNGDRPRSSWLLDFYNNDTNLNSLKQQCKYWESSLHHINSADELPPKMILSAVVLDPRLSMPTTRIKAVNTGVTGLQAAMPVGLSSNSPLWDVRLRDVVTHSKMTSAQLNTLRSQALVPGLATPSWLGHHNVSHLSILLVQNPGSRNRDQPGYGSGWDVIAPASWGMPLWLGFVFRGARPGGLRETEKLSLETASGPTLQPDTEAGQQHNEQCRKHKEGKHFRLPPDKRPNYIKLGVVCPFHYPWSKLLENWHPGEDNRQFYVLRDRPQLDFLKNLWDRTKPITTYTFTDNDKACGLIQVGIEMCGRGTVGECSMICALAKKDLKLIKNKSGHGPTEPLHEDYNEEKRKTTRDTHIVKLKGLRRKRVKAKQELEDQGIFSVKSKCKTSPTEKLVSDQAKLMKELWLPSEIKNVKNSSSRSVMGFIVNGDYSFTQSRCYGYGFVTLSALLTVHERSQGYVLIRTVSSLQYYIARLKLMSPV